MRLWSYRFSTLIKFLLVLVCCIQCLPGIKREISPDKIPAKVSDNKNQYLKAHMNDGSLYVLNTWLLNDSGNLMTARGEHYNANRKLMAASADTFFRIKIKDVALYESNDVTGLGGKIGLQALVTTPALFFTIFCMANPKACFGSCPTFYAWDGKKMKLMAEGFSSSIARAFEKPDIDMLYHSVVTGREFKLLLTNEALETHAIRFADLLVFPRNKNERVFATQAGTFYSTRTILAPTSCIGPEGDCVEKVRHMDLAERFSTADNSDLKEKEILDVSFSDVPEGPLGLIIGSRQTLMTTFLFYQGMAHAGSRMPEYLAEVERGNKRMQRHMTRLWDLLGGIEIFLQSENGVWKKVADLDEMGPIAADLHLIPLPENQRKNTSIRLRMTKGLYRIDQLALMRMDREVHPVRIQPSRVMKDSIADDVAKAVLNDTNQYLPTFPGNKYELIYNLPSEGVDYEVFLYSKGYYLEWMREEWIKEEDNLKMALMFAFPKYYLKLMTPEFKKVEPGMEESFWNSRYVKN